MLFSTDIASAYPKDAEVKSWVRSYNLIEGILKIEDTFSLNKTLNPNHLNFMVWGEVSITTPGVVGLKVEQEKVELLYDKNTFTAQLDTIQLDDEKFTKIWGKQIYRLSLIAKELKMSGKYQFCVISIKG